MLQAYEYEYMTDEVWSLWGPLVKAAKVKGGCRPKIKDRDFIEGYLRLQQSGARWRDLPDRFGSYDALYERFRRWQANGTWDRLAEALMAQGWMEHVMLFVDSTIVRAHQCAAGARQEKGGPRPRRWGVREAA